MSWSPLEFALNPELIWRCSSWSSCLEEREPVAYKKLIVICCDQWEFSCAQQQSMDIRRELKLTDVNYCRCFWTLKIVVCVALSPQVFVHGALCVSYSGQCFSSEAWGGRSANRGQCAQACRLPYGLVTHPPLRSKPACRKCSGPVISTSLLSSGRLHLFEVKDGELIDLGHLTLRYYRYSYKAARIIRDLVDGWSCAKLLLRFGCQHEVSWSSKLAVNFLLFALLVVSKVPFEDLQVWPYIAPSLHRFTALMKSHQIHPDPTIVTALSRRCCPLLAVPARLDGSGYSVFLTVFSGVLSSWKEVQLCPAFDR